MNINNHDFSEYKNTIEPKPGEKWYVRMGGLGAKITHVKVVDITPRTCQIQELCKYGAESIRYIRSAVEFIEKVES